MNLNDTNAELTLGDLRGIGMVLLERALQRYELSQAEQKGVRIPPMLGNFTTESERAASLRLTVEKICGDYPASKTLLGEVENFIHGLLQARSAKLGFDQLQKIQQFVSDKLGARYSDEQHAILRITPEKNGEVFLGQGGQFTPHPNLEDSLKRESAETAYVAAAMQVCQEYRSRNEYGVPRVPLTAVDEIALEKAYRLLDGGARLPRYFEPLRKGATRRYQTYLSFADPGDGHLKETVRDSRLLDGTIVHIEWIDREGVDSKDMVEAYRLPALRSAARVRLHVGDETPCTAFIGRPIFENKKAPGPGSAFQFELDLLKSAHMTASACSGMFALGVVDCKVAMDGMTTGQAVRFMRAVAGNVLRDPDTQMLSAAFNLNTPLREDRHGAVRESEVSDPVAIANLGIDLVREGKFDKIAWDGAADVQPSVPVLRQLGMATWLELIHRAHRYGLETYISAGMVSEHMRHAVYVGVGGVGIGTSLHYRGEKNRIGEIDPEAVLRTLEIRNQAVTDDAGKAACLLARLDWQWSEGSLADPVLLGLRGELHARLTVVMQEFDSLTASITEAKAKKEPAEDFQTRLAELGRNDQELRSILDRIGRHAQAPSLGIGVEADEVVLAFGESPAKTADGQRPAHPLVERAGRTVAAYRGRGENTPFLFDEQEIELMEQFTETNDLHGLAGLFADYEIRRASGDVPATE